MEIRCRIPETDLFATLKLDMIFSDDNDYARAYISIMFDDGDRYRCLNYIVNSIQPPIGLIKEEEIREFVKARFQKDILAHPNWAKYSVAWDEIMSFDPYEPCGTYIPEVPETAKDLMEKFSKIICEFAQAKLMCPAFFTKYLTKPIDTRQELRAMCEIKLRPTAEEVRILLGTEPVDAGQTLKALLKRGDFEFEDDLSAEIYDSWIQDYNDTYGKHYLENEVTIRP